MLTSATVAYIHYLGFMLSFGALVLERRLIRQDLSVKDATLLVGTDLVYGMAALAVLVTGILRVKYFGQGADFYLQNPVFITKVGLYLTLGGLSLYPTFTIIRWVFPLREGKAPEVSETTVGRIKTALNLELAGMVVLPLLAALMARGIGLSA